MGRHFPTQFLEWKILYVDSNFIEVNSFGPLLLTWFDLNPNMDKRSHAQQIVGIPKLQRLHRRSLGMDKQFHTTFYNGCDYLFMLGLKLIVNTC